MLFAIIYKSKENWTEATDKRSYDLYNNWKPPQGFEFKSHYAFADGRGGFAIAEASSPAAVYEAHIPWAAYYDFETIPVISIEDSIKIQQRVFAWRDSVRQRELVSVM